MLPGGSLSLLNTFEVLPDKVQRKLGDPSPRRSSVHLVTVVMDLCVQLKNLPKYVVLGVSVQNLDILFNLYCTARKRMKT